MARYTVGVSLWAPCYGTATIEAGSKEEAANKFNADPQKYLSSMTFEATEFMQRDITDVEVHAEIAEEGSNA